MKIDLPVFATPEVIEALWHNLQEFILMVMPFLMISAAFYFAPLLIDVIKSAFGKKNKKDDDDDFDYFEY